MCVHNIAFQGRFWPDEFGSLGLPAESRDLFNFSDGYPKVSGSGSSRLAMAVAAHLPACNTTHAIMQRPAASQVHRRAAAPAPAPPPRQVFDANSPADEASKLPEIKPGTNFSKLNWLKAGILACDKLLTVSPNYATEIASGPQLGVELDGVVRVSPHLLPLLLPLLLVAAAAPGCCCCSCCCNLQSVADGELIAWLPTGRAVARPASPHCLAGWTAPGGWPEQLASLEGPAPPAKASLPACSLRLHPPPHV